MSGDGTLVAAAGEDGVVYVWNVETGAVHCEFKGHSAYVTSVFMANSGNVVASASGDGSVRVWQVRRACSRCRALHGASRDSARVQVVRKDLLRKFKGHRGVVWSVVVVDDGSTCMSSGADGTVRVWNVDVGTAAACFRVDAGEVFALSSCELVSRVVVTGAVSGRVSLWDWRTAAVLWQHSEHRVAVRSVWLSEDGRFVFSSDDDGVVVRVDADTGGDAIALRTHTQSVTSVCASFDGVRAFSSSRDGTVCAWAFT
jgi:WD40 repeat protein